MGSEGSFKSSSALALAFKGEMRYPGNVCQGEEKLNLPYNTCWVENGAARTRIEGNLKLVVACEGGLRRRTFTTTN